VRPSARSRLSRSPNRLFAALERRAAVGRTHLDLTVSNPTRANVPRDGRATIAALANEASLLYEPEPFGLLPARRAVAELFGARGVAVDASRVVLTASTSEAYSFLFKLLCDPGDRVLVPRPSYPLLEHLCRYEGVECAPYFLRYDGAWHVDFPSILAARTERTRAIVVVTPNNPTGSYLKRDELERLAEIGLPIISDEVFAAYSALPDPRRVASALEASGASVFALDGLSKFAALPQMKLAWIAVGGADPAASEALAGLELICDSFLSPSAAVQHALPSLLSLSAGPRATIQRRVVHNYGVLSRCLAGTALTPLTYEGGWYGVVRLPAVRTEIAWALGLLEERDVLVQPGFFYDFESEPFIVVSLLTDDVPFAEGVRRLVDYVASSV
jgi:aspartate/methionine/tyrosine aminotransferase